MFNVTRKIFIKEMAEILGLDYPQMWKAVYQKHELPEPTNRSGRRVYWSLEEAMKIAKEYDPERFKQMKMDQQ